MRGSPVRETLIETGDGHTVFLALTGSGVSVDWYGPVHAEFTTEQARTIGYLLRGYARLAEQGNESRG